MFDLSFGCDHLVWTFGDPGDCINANQLGGADAASWLSKVSIDRVFQRTGGPEGVARNIQQALDYASDNNLESRLVEMGHLSSAEHIGEISATLRKALSDAQFSRKFGFPREN